MHHTSTNRPTLMTSLVRITPLQHLSWTGITWRRRNEGSWVRVMPHPKPWRWPRSGRFGFGNFTSQHFGDVHKWNARAKITWVLPTHTMGQPLHRRRTLMTHLDVQLSTSRQHHLPSFFLLGQLVVSRITNAWPSRAKIKIENNELYQEKVSVKCYA